MRWIRNIVCTAIGVASLASLAAAQSPPTQAQRDLLREVFLEVSSFPDSLTVGDPVTVEVRVRVPIDAQVQFARSARTDEYAAVQDVQILPPADPLQDWVARYTLSLYAVGDVTLPPWPVRVERDSITVTAHTDSIFLFVESVLDDSLSQADLQDIKGQRDVPVPLPRWAWIVAGLVLLGALLLWVWLRRRKRRVEIVPVVPPRPAHEVALAALRKLETRRLPLDGKVKEHYIELSEILRGYLEDAPQFALPALEETTEEIVAELDKREVPDNLVLRVRELCEEADLVKFAKYLPPVDECMQALGRVVDFVHDTSKQAILMPQPAELEGAGR